MNNKRKIIVQSLIVISIISYFILISREIDSKDVAPEKYTEFKEYDLTDITSVNFFKSIGFDEYSKIDININKKDELFQIVNDSLKTGEAGRFNSTKEYKIVFEMKSGVSYSAIILIQNFNAIRIIFEGRRYNSDSLLKWFEINKDLLR